MGGRRDLKSVPYSLRDSDPDLYNFLLDLANSEADGVPGGVTLTTPTTVQADDAGTIGTESLGWAPGDHEHAVETGTAVGLGNANAGGSGTPLARADHVHKRDVRIKALAVDNIRNAVRFIGSNGIGVVAADDSGDDETEVTISGQTVGEESLFYAFFVGD